MPVAFVLGGGGLLGAHEVGMLRALAEAGIRPDLVVGTSIGALNGAFGDENEGRLRGQLLPEPSKGAQFEIGRASCRERV